MHAKQLGHNMYNWDITRETRSFDKYLKPITSRENYGSDVTKSHIV
jgi:hypothetical protein